MQDLKSGIEHLKQAKAHMSKANGIMSNHISKLKELEEENAGLRDELDDWKGNAEGFQPDAYMKLPLDADGVPIRIGDTVYTRDAEEYTVRGIYALADEYGISVVPLGGTCFLPMEPEGLTHRTTDSADSWEKLEEDAKQRVCSYFGVDPENASCEDCPYGSTQTGSLCWRNASLDMIARAKKLAGIEDEAQR